jgi:outer membrane protein OmpA-like peptidoglycan-associated protein
MKNLMISILLLSCPALSGFAQDDAEGCSDHALLTRMPAYYISGCSHSYNQAEIVTGSANGEQVRKTVEGNVTSIEYNQKEGNEGKLPSWFQVVKNYDNALAKVGAKKIFSDGGVATFHLTGKSKEVWISLELNTSDAEGANLYSFYAKIIEMEEMKQEVQANDIYEKLNADGHIALYINFETGKSEISPDSQQIIGEMAEMLKANPTLNVSIEGHTDNSGTPAGNKTLSENRAKAVVTALVAKGIGKTRLSSKGWGQDRPVADNTTDDGKAKNRRVEVVKL